MSKITIYSTTTCGFCKSLKSYLKSKDIKYDEKLADLDPKLAQELYERSGQLSVPFTIIEHQDGNEEMILGFDRTKIDTVLGLS